MRTRGQGSAYPAVVRSRDGLPRLLAFAGLTALGSGLLVLAWVSASGKTRYEDQLGALNVGIVGTTVVLGSCALYLVTFRRAVRARVARLRPDQDPTFSG